MKSLLSTLILGGSLAIGNVRGQNINIFIDNKEEITIGTDIQTIIKTHPLTKDTTINDKKNYNVTINGEGAAKATKLSYSLICSANNSPEELSIIVYNPLRSDCDSLIYKDNNLDGKLDILEGCGKYIDKKTMDFIPEMSSLSDETYNQMLNILCHSYSQHIYKTK